MIYLNYAATSWPKPQCVIDAYNNSITSLPSAQYRSSGICDNSDLFAQTREELAELFGIQEKERIYFASGSTDGLNRIIRGLNLPASAFLTTATEHNSVLRPLYNLPKAAERNCFQAPFEDLATDAEHNSVLRPSCNQTEGEDPVIVPCDGDGFVHPEELEAAIRPGTRAIIVNHCSNVTGAIQDLAAIGKIARRHHLIYILDVSQSAGCIPIHADEWGIDGLAFTGHKSLYGVQGTGGYYVRSTIPLKPLLYGGTGKDSRRIRYEEADSNEYEYEVGTQNSSGIAALLAAVRYIKEEQVSRIHEEEKRRLNYLISRLADNPAIHIIGRDLPDRGPVLSLTIPGMEPGDIAYILQTGYGIITRAGLQCAPLIHQAIGTGEKGTLRLSISHTTTKEELDEVILALSDITDAMKE